MEAIDSELGHNHPLKHVLEHSSQSSEGVREMVRGIYVSVLEKSPYLKEGNFRSIHSSDLERLFAAYDEVFFRGWCGRLASGDGRDLRFRLSKRMTSAGGTTTRWRPRGGRPGKTTYEIAISTTLLFQTFHDVQRPICVAGIICTDRLEALMRVFEHELIHLSEMLVWGDSSCAAPRFARIGSKLFAHTDTTHQLITPRERAHAVYGIQVGDRVHFQFEGVERQGVVNRITKRATVLVPDPRGERYSDGKRYAKFYVPLSMLRPVAE